MAKKDAGKKEGSRSASVDRDLDADSAAAYLEYIARGLRERRVVIDGGSDLVDSAIATPVGLSVKAKASNSKKRKASLDIHLTWRAPEPPAEESPQTGEVTATLGSTPDVSSAPSDGVWGAPSSDAEGEPEFLPPADSEPDSSEASSGPSDGDRGAPGSDAEESS